MASLKNLESKEKTNPEVRGQFALRGTQMNAHSSKKHWEVECGGHPSLGNGVLLVSLSSQLTDHISVHSSGLGSLYHCCGGMGWGSSLGQISPGQQKRP